MDNHPANADRDDVIANLWHRADLIHCALAHLAGRLPTLESLDLLEVDNDLNDALADLQHTHPAVLQGGNPGINLDQVADMTVDAAKTHIAAAIRDTLLLIPTDTDTVELKSACANLASELALTHHALTGRMP